MASRFRSLSKQTFSIVKSTINKPALKPNPPSSLLPDRRSPSFSSCVFSSVEGAIGHCLRVCFAVQTQELDYLQNN
ncbi:hypothetical protein V6N13_118968 [Hibiscus sabdariffa]|uniref:Uncharacterized protein n=1 Tax=Hibiscus sabdariffa TaxID=183260 RepID=A0ABR2E1N3_9ROSI